MKAKDITAKEFLELDGLWNRKLYAHDIAYKGGVAYHIVDAENLKNAKKVNEIVFNAMKLADIAQDYPEKLDDATVEDVLEFLKRVMLHLSEKNEKYKGDLFVIGKAMHDLETKIIRERR